MTAQEQRAALLREWLAERKTGTTEPTATQATKPKAYTTEPVPIAETTGRGVKLYSVTEAASRLGLDPSEVRRQIRNGRLRAHKTSAGYVMTEAQLLRFEQHRLPRGRPRKRPQ